jgi:sensor histidine kinase YesM
MISMIIQMFFYGLLLIVLGSSISAMVLFVYIMNEQIEKTIAQSKEVADQKLKIMTLQMRPHFVYNTLINIYYLCDSDPAKAKSAIKDFTNYLRHNFTAIEKEEAIPFDEELKHARAYLDVVKVRFEQQLFVEYDIEYTSFRIPALTLEPIVENAVKHGLDPDSSPLNILMSTSRQSDHILITVEDNGLGYMPMESEAVKKAYGEDGDSHLGLSNVRSRLKEMCAGTLEVEQRVGGGTKVTIKIPKI